MNGRIIILLCALTLAAGLMLFSRPGQAHGQNQERLQRPPLPEKELVTEMRVDESAAEATGLPRADLIIKEMCFEAGKKGGLNSVRVLLANTGSVDAGTFELGFNYINADGNGRLALDKVDGLKAGEEKWVEQFHMCCGFVPTVFLVDTAVRYQAIADPRYYRRHPTSPLQTYEVKSVIPESNERNNQMAANKSELKPCTPLHVIDRPTPPRIQPVRPPRP